MKSLFIILMVHIMVPFYNEQGKPDTGEIVCNQSIAQDLKEIFSELYKAKYRFTSIRPISEFGNDDERSMSANNTSCYCYRKIKGQKKLSKHAQGLAIDINPLYNPQVKHGKIRPANGAPYAYKHNHNMCIKKNDLIYNLFISHGFSWGGSWRSSKDYQHFEK